MGARITDRDQTDIPTHHRSNVTGADTSSVVGATLGLLIPENSAQTTLNKAFLTEGVRNLEVRVFGVGADNDSCVIQVVGFTQPVADGKTYPKGASLLTATATVGTSTSANINPITGVAVAATTFRETDTFTVSAANTAYVAYDAAGSNGQSRLVIDPLAFTYIYVYITTLTGLTRVDVSIRRIG